MNTQSKSTMPLNWRITSSLVVSAAVIVSCLSSVHAFAPATLGTHRTRTFSPNNSVAGASSHHTKVYKSQFTTKLYAEEDSNDKVTSALGDSEATILGTVGIVASIIMIYSESVLFQTGCGLPAGPAGLVGGLEGISYLSVVGLVAYSIFTKIRTGSGLPAGPGGVLGAAEGLAYLAVFAGFWVLLAQVTNYGYIPNAVPMEGGMCK